MHAKISAEISIASAKINLREFVPNYVFGDSGEKIDFLENQNSAANYCEQKISVEISIASAKNKYPRIRSQLCFWGFWRKDRFLGELKLHFHR